MYTIGIISSGEIVATYTDVIDHDEEYDENLGENILWLKRKSHKGIKEKVLILCGGWQYCTM